LFEKKKHKKKFHSFPVLFLKFWKKGQNQKKSFMKSLLHFLLLTSFVVLTGMLALLVIPSNNIPIPACVRQNAIMRQFFAWDCAEDFETKFDDQALRDYLAHNQKKRE
jgi:hypothetical protein